MSLLSYFKFVDTTWVRDNSGKLGLLIDTDHGKEFYYFGTGNFNQLINSDYFRSFSCQIDVGSCVFTKEFRKSGDTTKGYWYASKKINGKLRRVYFGCKSFTLDALEATLAKFSTPKKQTVTQEVTQKQSAPVPEFINDFAVGDRVAYANPVLKYQENRGIGEVAEVTDSHLFIVWQDDENMLCPMPKRSRDKLMLVAGHGKSDRYLQPLITDEILAANQEKIKSLEKELALRQQEVIIFRDEASAYHNELEQLKWDSSNYESQQDKLLAYQATIEKYRQLALGKTKKDNPRFAYLIDFLAEIDKLS